MAGSSQKQTFSISEETRISFTTKLRQLREDDSVEEVRFPSTLDNVERKFLHHLAGQLGLVSKSRGKVGSRNGAGCLCTILSHISPCLRLAHRN